MKKTLLLLLAILLFGAFLFFARTTDRPRETKPLADLPWMVQINAAGNSSVFGQTLGSTPLRDLQSYVKREAAIRLFRNPDGTLSVEAYFEKVDMSGLISNLIVELDIPRDELQKLESTAISRKATPTGAYELQLSPDEEQSLMDETFNTLTYTPIYVRLDDPMIRQRFGDPVEIITTDEDSRHFLYPDIGLDIMVTEKGKAIFQYVAPSDFGRILEKIDPQSPVSQE